MEFIWILIAAISVFVVFVFMAGRSDSRTDSGPGHTTNWSDDDDEYDNSGDFGQQSQAPLIFIQINQFISFNESYPPVVRYNEKIPRFVTTNEGFKAKGMQSREPNFRRILLSNRLIPGNSYRAVVTLQIEHGNPHDVHAVQVSFQGLVLAHIPRELSPQFHSALRAVGGIAVCVADIWFDGKRRRGPKINSITLFTSRDPQLES